MAETLFAEILKSALDVPSIDEYFLQDRDLTQKVLSTIRPEGRVDGGRFKLASVEGGAGGSFDFNFQNHYWGDHAANDHHKGVVGFVETALRCSTAQAVKWLIDKKFLDAKEAKKALAKTDGDPLVLPIPENQRSWEAVLEADCLRKDRGIIKDHWEYKDLDGSLLGWKYRVDSRNTTKEIYTLTFRAEGGWVKKPWQKKLVPPYGLECLRDGPTVRVLFVEGEKARDAAVKIFGDRWKVLSFSGVKAADELWLPDEPFWDDCEIVIWPDNDAPGKEAARKLQLALQKLEHKFREMRIVRVESIAGIGPGWDLGDWTESSSVDPVVELERAEEIDSFDRVCREWCYVAQEDKFYNLEDRQVILSPAAFDRYYTRYGDKTGTPSKKFLQSLETRRAEDLDFLPGFDSFITTPGGKYLLNEWYPGEVYKNAREIANNPKITDVEIEDKCRFFLTHLERVGGGEVVEPEKDQDGLPITGTEGRLLRDALAHFLSGIVKRPMDKQGWFPIIVSEHNGTGKSYFRRVMESILGGKRVQELTVKQYTSDYEDWMDGTLFYEIGEVKSEDAGDVYELLKKNHSYKPFNMEDLRDRAQGVRHVNIKGSKQKQQRNFLNGFMTSNRLFPIALANSSGLEGSDRRLLAIHSEKILTEQQNSELFDDELVHRASWIGAWLMRYESPAHWNPSWAPMTAHKRLMLEKDRERSENRSDKTELGKFDEFFHFVMWGLDEKQALFRRKVIKADDLRGFCERSRIRFPYDPGRFERILEKAGLRKGPILTIDGQPTKVFAIDLSYLERPVADWIKELKISVDATDQF